MLYRIIIDLQDFVYAQHDNIIPNSIRLINEYPVTTAALGYLGIFLRFPITYRIR